MLSRNSHWPTGGKIGLVALATLLAGCSANHYRKSADKETYGIVQHIEQQIFGHTNAFTIDTPYSGRNPKTIPPAEIIEDRTASNRFSINLDQALDLAVKHSREYQTQKEQLYLTSLSLTGARYEFSPQFFADSTAQLAGTPAGADIGTVNNRIGVNQLLKTGGSLSVALANDLVHYFTGKPVDVARDSAVNRISIDLTQPLLRGFGINNPAVESLTQAERNVVYAIRSFTLYQQQFAVDTVQAYFNLLTLKDIVRNDFINYTNRVQITQYSEARVVDREKRINADDARNAELSARSSYINSLASYLTALDAFKIRLGLPLSTDLYLDDRDLAELIANGITSVEVDRHAAFRICVDKQMDVLNAIDRFEDSKRKVRLAADQLRADVNIFAGATLRNESEDYVDYTEFDLDNLQYTAGLRLNLPVDRLRERNTYRAALVSFESQLRSLSLTLDNFRDRIDRGLRSVEQARLNYLNSLESLKVAERRVENSIMSFEAGRAIMRDVREAQDELIQWQNRLATTVASYLNSRLDLLLTIGIIDTQPKRFWLQDPLKDTLTPEQRSTPLLRMPDDQVVPPEHFLEPVL